jgi:hypothetical protein
VSRTNDAWIDISGKNSQYHLAVEDLTLKACVAKIDPVATPGSVTEWGVAFLTHRIPSTTDFSQLRLAEWVIVLPIADYRLILSLA